jgi:hypothetical protein
MSKKTLPYPFDNYNSDMIIEIADQIKYMEFNHGHSFDLLVNGKRTDDLPEIEQNIIAYIKFLGLEANMLNKIGNYAINSIDINDFLTNVIKVTNASIKKSLDKEKRPHPADILDDLGQISNPPYGIEVLFRVIDLIMATEGYYAVPGTYYKVFKDEPISDNLTNTADLIYERYRNQVSYILKKEDV